MIINRKKKIIHTWSVLKNMYKVWYNSRFKVYIDFVKIFEEKFEECFYKNVH